MTARTDHPMLTPIKALLDACYEPGQFCPMLFIWHGEQHTACALVGFNEADGEQRTRMIEQTLRLTRATGAALVTLLALCEARELGDGTYETRGEPSQKMFLTAYDGAVTVEMADAPNDGPLGEWGPPPGEVAGPLVEALRRGCASARQGLN